MKTVNMLDKNIKIEGIYDFDNTHKLRRYTDAIIEKYPRLAEFDKRCTGARARFRTDSRNIHIEMKVSDHKNVDRGMSFYQANTAYVYTGDYSSSVYRGLVSAPDTYDSDHITADISNDGLHDVTVFFPRNTGVEDLNITIDDDAALLPPSEHKIKLPFVFYGSSITEQGLTSTPLAYASLLSRFFDADFYNFGASGNARGETEIAEYLGSIKKSVFFYDYDHNAPSADWLRETHEPFFIRFRELDPVSPVIMTSRPSNDTPDFEEREEIVRRTYENAVRAGDKNVYFVEGKKLFGDADPQICTTDVTHPNDLGHYQIACTLKAFIEKNGIL